MAKMDVGLAAGADVMLPYDTMSPDELKEAIQNTTPDSRGADVVYDGVGKNTFDVSLACLRKRGTCVLFGNASGAVPPMDPMALVANSLFLTRPKLYDYIQDKEELERRSDELFEWVRQGKLKVTIQESFPLEQAAQAHKFIEGRNTVGKVIFKL